MLRELPHYAPFAPLQKRLDALTARGLPLESAQQQIAESHGFLTWRQLEVHLQIAEEPSDAFEYLACLSYVWWDRPRRWEQARAMFSDNPALEQRDIYAACVTGNVQLVEAFLDDDAKSLERRGGYCDWEPLLYACYSRIELPDRSTSDVVHLLLDRGANPAAFFRWGGIYHFSALTGLFGEGERGPINQPPHQDYQVLTTRLLDAGASCNDSQALYNRMFQPDNSTLLTLIEHGLNKDHLCNWFATVRGGRLVPNPAKTLDYQLQWAVKSNFIDRVKILLEHGANPTQKLPGDGRLAKIAATRGYNDVTDDLIRHGAKPYRLGKVDRFLNYCLSANRGGAEAMLAKSQTLIKRADKRNPDAMNSAAANGTSDALELMLDLGFCIHSAATETPLHHAAHNGHLDTVKNLLDRGASLHKRDPMYLATPLGWAQAGNKYEVIEYLENLAIGLFDLINVNDSDRIRHWLTEHPEELNAPLEDSLETTLKKHPNAWQTPLAYAATSGLADMVEVLLLAGADKNVASKDGTPLADLCNEEVRKLLV